MVQESFNESKLDLLPLDFLEISVLLLLTLVVFPNLLDLHDDLAELDQADFFE